MLNTLTKMEIVWRIKDENGGVNMKILESTVIRDGHIISEIIMTKQEYEKFIEKFIQIQKIVDENF